DALERASGRRLRQGRGNQARLGGGAEQRATPDQACQFSSRNHAFSPFFLLSGLNYTSLAPEKAGHPRQGTNSTPGFIRLCGSNTCLILRIISSRTGSISRSISLTSLRPTPCSALKVPPKR